MPDHSRCGWWRPDSTSRMPPQAPMLDGFPRTRPQAEALDRAAGTPERARSPPRCTSRSTPPELVKRLAGRRVCTGAQQHVYTPDHATAPGAGCLRHRWHAPRAAPRRSAGDHAHAPGAPAAADVRGRGPLRRDRRAAPGARRPAASTKSPTNCCASPSGLRSAPEHGFDDRRVTLKSASPDRAHGRRRAPRGGCRSMRSARSIRPGVTHTRARRIADGPHPRPRWRSPPSWVCPGTMAPYEHSTLHLASTTRSSTASPASGASPRASSCLGGRRRHRGWLAR